MQTTIKITTIAALEMSASLDFTRHEDHGTAVPAPDTQVRVFTDEDGNTFADVAAHYARWTDNETGETTERWCESYTDSID